MEVIKKFWGDSYRSNPTAFYLELVSFLFVVAASLTLALNAKNPNMIYIYPLFLISSVTALLAHIRRKLAWPLLASSYFVGVNVLGFCKAINLL